ncbi:MAG TPA: patatin-like phospholipase family protein [Methylocella sp.]|nr:patatin-like phospholipase family protein [Methylocella sp.]
MIMTNVKDLQGTPKRRHFARNTHLRTEQLNRLPPLFRDNFSGAGDVRRLDRMALSTFRRPKIGVALGAGAARGWSHIGVLRELEAQGIYPDVIAGTSIGAVVGGAYAAGKLKEMERFALSLTKKRVLGMMDVSFSGVSFLAGDKLRRELEKEFAGRTFENLEKAFATVATEYATGHEIWLTKGSVTDAIRASYALPGIFEPVKINGRWLFDGALVNPIPVTLCRVLGAEVVIAVNLVSDTTYRGTVFHDPLSIEPTLQDMSRGGSDPVRSLSARIFGGMGGNLRRLFGKREDGAPGIANAMMDAFNIAQGRISRSRLAGDPPDVLINARLGKIGLFDFHRAEELISIGREATRRAMPEILSGFLEIPSDIAPAHVQASTGA